MKRAKLKDPRCTCSHKRPTHFKGYFGCLGRYVDDKGRVEPCPCKAYKASDQPKAFDNAPYKRSGDMKGPHQLLQAQIAGAKSPQELRAILNPLTVKEQAQLLRSAKLHAQFAKANFKSGHEKQAQFDKGYAQGLARAAVRYGGTQSRKKKDVFGFQTPKWRASRVEKKVMRIARGNPAAPGKLIGPRCILIRTNLEQISINSPAPIYGLKDGSIFIRGFFGRAPKGFVDRIEYMDDAKAAREGLKAKGIPWRHDFSKEKRPISKVPGGLLIRAGKRPLWGMR